MADWYYTQGGQQFGPMPLPQLQALVRNGSVLATDLVWNATLTNWIQVDQVPELRGGPPPAQARPPQPQGYGPPPAPQAFQPTGYGQAPGAYPPPGYGPPVYPQQGYGYGPPLNYAGAQPRDFLTTILLCVFVGGLGIHRFYTGHAAIGIVQLLTLGGCGVWTLIDLILIATGSYLDAEGRPLRR